MTKYLIIALAVILSACAEEGQVPPPPIDFPLPPHNGPASCNSTTHNPTHLSPECVADLMADYGISRAKICSNPAVVCD